MEDKNPKNNVGLSPLHIATGEDKIPRKDIGTTPLHIAAYQSHLKICQYTIKNMEDKNPKAKVKQLHFIKVTSKYHLKYGGQIPKNIVGLTPLGIASSEDKNPRNIYGARSLTNLPTYTNVTYKCPRDHIWRTLLHWTAKDGHLAICKLFVTHSVHDWKREIHSD